jgi:hypothetical protein
MFALPRNQYSTTFSLDGIGSPTSPSRGRHVPATFKPAPLKSFTVVVSVVPADQLRLNSSPSASANLALDGVGGAAGVGGPPAMASSIPTTGATAAVPPPTSGYLMNSSFSPVNASFALTKSFGDVFALKRPPGGGSGPLGSSGRSNHSFCSLQGFPLSSSAAAAAAAAAVNGTADPSISETPVPNSQDSYRVHLLLPADYPESPGATLSHASPTSVSATSPTTLDTRHTAKGRQAAQINEHWVLFQQLVRFVLSVAPRFEPPPTPPGLAFPVDLGLSFVQNSSIFAAETTALPQNKSFSSLSRLGGPASTGSLGTTAHLAESRADDPLVRGEEREARRAYMEVYLNAAIRCDQVNCLKELQAFVGYDAYTKNVLAHLRTMSRTSSSSSIAGSPGTTLAQSSSSRLLHSAGQPSGNGDGGRSEFNNRGPLGSSSQSTSLRSQCTVSTTSSASRHVAAATTPATAVEARKRIGTGSASAVDSRAASSHTSEVSAPSPADAFDVSPPLLARSIPSTSPSINAFDELRRSSSNTVATMGGGATRVRGAVEVVDLSGAKTPLAVSGPGGGGSAAATSSSRLSDGSQLVLQQTAVKAGSRSSAVGSMGAASLSSIASGTGGGGGGPLLTANADAVETAARARTTSTVSSTTHNPLHLPVPTQLPPPHHRSTRSSGARQKGSAIDDDTGIDSPTSSSPSAGSSFESSVSHPSNTRRRSRQPHHSHHHHHHQRHHLSHDSKRQNSDYYGGGAEEEAAATPASVFSGPAGDAINAAVAAAPAMMSRADLKSLVSIAPETERMLTECFRMMDIEECGYVSAAECLLFYLCATSNTFTETLYLCTNAAGLAEDRDGAAAGRPTPPSAAQLEALVPAWMRDCDSVVVGNPEYLMSCTRFVDAVREILAVSAAMGLTSAVGRTASGGGTSSAGVEGDRSSSARPPSKPQTSTGGEGALRSATPASAAPSPGGLPAVLGSSRLTEATLQPVRPGERAEGANHVGGSSAHAHSGAGSVPVEETALDSLSVPAVTAPVVSLESWIDNYWLLMYSRLFTAMAALVVGAEAAELRAALLRIRERAYLEMTAQVATAVAAATQLRQGKSMPLSPQQQQQHPQSSAGATDGNAVSAGSTTSSAHLSYSPAASSPLALELVYPPWLLREVAAALAAQPPILGCFDALELLSLVYVISESGISVVAVENVLQWLGTRSCQPNTHFSLDDFASLMDVLSCSLPFADVLHCVRRQWQALHDTTKVSGSGEHRRASEGGSRDPHSSGETTAVDRNVFSRQQHAHLLRLISRCAATDPAGGLEFNELVQQQRWRRGGGDAGAVDGSGRICGQCQLAHGVLEQQALLLETLSEENERLQGRIAELEAAAAAAATNTVAMTASRAAHDDPPTQPSPQHVPSPFAASPAAVAHETKENAVVPLSSDGAPYGTEEAVNTHTSATLASPLLEVEAEPLAHRAPRSALVELIPVFTAEDNEIDVLYHHRSPTSGDGLTQHHLSKQARAAATQVARPGPLLYTVPQKYAQRLPSELEWTFYLCRAGQREGERNSRARGINISGSHSTDAGGSVPPLAPPVERLTVRDDIGNRVLAFKLCSNVLHILGRELESRPARLSLVTAPLSPRGACHHTAHGMKSLASATSPMRQSLSFHDRHHTHGIVGRELNILHPSFEDSDGDSGGNPYAPMYGGNALAETSHGAPGSSSTKRGRDVVESSSGDRRRSAPLSPDGDVAALEDAQPQRLVVRVELEAHVWYTLKLRMNWVEHTVDVVLTCIAANNAAPSPHRTQLGAAKEPRSEVVYEVRVRMLDAAEVAGVKTVEVFPRREMLVAYCNTVVRYDAKSH